MILDMAQMVILLVGFGGLTYWISALKGAIHAQDQAIKAQAESLKSQGEVVKTIQAAFASLDTPKMLERYKAYSAMVDEEKDAMLARQVRLFEEQKNKLFEIAQSALNAHASGTEILNSTLQAGQSAVDAIIAWAREDIRGAFRLLTSALPYVPPEKRKRMIDASSLDEQWKHALHELADSAPDLSLLTLRDLFGSPPAEESVQRPVLVPDEGEEHP